MKERWLTFALLCTMLWMSLGGAALADGFRLTEQSGEGLGMASAVSASTTEPTAVWYNPAALVFTQGFQASLTGVGYLGETSFTPRSGDDAIEAEPTTDVVPSGFVSARLHDRVAVGLGVNIPFGLGTEWPGDWSGRQYGIKSSITVLDVNPVGAFAILPDLSVAAGVNLMQASVDLVNGLPTSTTDTVRIGGSAFGLGANAAVLYRALPELLHVAATYRSRVELDFRGRAHFEVSEPVFSTQLFDQTGEATLTLPDQLSLGLMYRPVPSVRLGLDGYLVLWSTYDDVPIDFDSAETPDSGLRPDYHDIVTLSVGAEWSPPVEHLKLRIGARYDPSPAPASGLSPTLPDGTSLGSGIGIGYHTGSLGADLGYMLVVFMPSKARTSSDLSAPPQSLEGTYRTVGHLIGLTLTARVGARSTDR